ncbi:hypothetical protein BDL97_18G060100 [Sphagnum fallax]|nr:hypothetical protein BDL97_18G060100 [Sphagnum fallax]
METGKTTYSSSQMLVKDGERIEEEEEEEQQQQLRLHRFLQWLQVNDVQIRGCELRRCSNSPHSGIGVFATTDDTSGVLMVTPLLLAITPMTVLQDPLLGAHYCQLFEEGEVDDRLLIMLFLVVERARGQLSFWAPYFDVLPSKFGTPLCFNEEDLLGLEGTSLFHATQQQQRSLRALYDDKVKPVAESFLSAVEADRREVGFDDFMWANCIFWTRALNIPCPYSFVFPAQLPVLPALRALQDANPQAYPPRDPEGQLDVAPEASGVHTTVQPKNMETKSSESGHEKGIESAAELDGECGERFCDMQNGDEMKVPTESVWVEGLVPGIDFCNHDLMPVALWEVDGPEGHITGVPNSMYLVTGPGLGVTANSEVHINYGNKGNEELLYLYGFVMDTNPNDYLMIYFPKEALEKSACNETKSQLLAELNLPLRWLLPSSELKMGFCGQGHPYTSAATTDRIHLETQKPIASGDTKPPQCLMFPEDLLTALRIVAMEEDEVYRVVSLLEEISASQGVVKDLDIRTAVEQVCGNRGALQLLVDLLTSKMMEINEGTGPEDADDKLLAKDKQARLQPTGGKSSLVNSEGLLSENMRACVIYRKGQKLLCRLFLQGAESALDECVQSSTQPPI